MEVFCLVVKLVRVCLADRAKPGAALQTPPSLILSLNNLLNDPLDKHLYNALTPKWLEMVLSVIKQLILTFFQRI